MGFVDAIEPLIQVELEFLQFDFFLTHPSVLYGNNEDPQCSLNEGLMIEFRNVTY